MSFSQKGIKTELGFLVVGATLALAGFATFSIMTVSSMRETVEHLGHQRIPVTELEGNLLEDSNAVPRYLWRALAAEAGSPHRSTALKHAEQHINQMAQHWDQILTFKLSPETRQEITNGKPNLVKYVKGVEKTIAALKKGGSEDAAAKDFLFGEGGELLGSITETLLKASEAISRRNEAVVTEGFSNATRAQFLLVVLAIGAGGAVMVFGFVFANSLSNRLIKITETVGDASTQVSAASSQLADSAEKLSSNSQHQASALEETAASLTEIAGMIEQNVKGAEAASQIAKSVYSVSEETRSSMKDLSDAMSSILESNQKIEKLVKIIEEIGEKTEVIDDIVFKTQLLSFNASVEAERAGEYGRGFAVVAQEVGNLAQMSGKAASEISSIVKHSIKEAEAVATENKVRVEAGGKLAHETNEKTITVLEQLKSILDATSRIVSASKEQSLGVNQITTSVDSLSQSTQETAATAEESASASEELSGQAEALMSQVNDLRTVVVGAQAAEKQSSKTVRERKHAATPNNVVRIHPETKKAPQMKKVANGGYHAEVAAAETGPSNDGWEKL